MNKSNIIHVDFKKPVKLTGSERINLRELWYQLGIQKKFADWARQQLRNFVEHHEFGSFPLKVKRENGASILKEFWVTLDVAKQICMLSRTEEGRRVRRYFLDCEKLVFENGLDTELGHVPCVVSTEFFISVSDRMRELEWQRDEAIRTKGRISEGQLATAMNKASQAVKDRNRVFKLLELQIGKITELSQLIGGSR